MYDALRRRISKAIADYVTHSTLRTDDVLAVDVKSTKLASSTESYFYLKDALGSVIDIVDSSGNLKQYYVYSSFSKIVSIKDGFNHPGKSSNSKFFRELIDVSNNSPMSRCSF